jgi:Tfp pilus assembly protein FimV
MKIRTVQRGQGWAAMLALVIIFTGCAHKPEKPVAAPPASRESVSVPGTPGGVPASPRATPQEPGRIPPPPVGASPQEAPPPPKESYYTHTVKWSGETLFIIAAWYTGDRENWKILAEVMTQNNPNANIHRISTGSKILVPESIMKTKDPMPREFVETFYPKTKTEKPPSKPASSQSTEEEPQLFGPRQMPKK